MRLPLEELRGMLLEGNPKKHDIEELHASFRDYGFIGDVVVSNSVVIGGNGRIQALDAYCKAGNDPPRNISVSKDGAWMVPVIVADWIPAEQHDAVSLALNEVGRRAGYDQSALKNILKKLAESTPNITVGFDLDAIRQIRERKMESISDMLQSKGSAAEEQTGDADEKFKPSDVPNALFSTNNRWGIPVLDLSLQADYVDSPFEKWGRTARHRGKSYDGSVHFYTDDYKFTALWKHPEHLPNSGAVSVVEPNFSCGADTPVAVGLYYIYKKRWLSRYWQTCGLRVFVDMNVAEKFDDYNMLGVPQGWKAYATRGYTELEDAIDMLDAAVSIAMTRAGVDRPEDLLFVVYGGGLAIRQYCDINGLTFITEESDSVRGRT
jgi:hypothetical protein